MTPLHALWLPILLSAVLVFVVSSLIHMVLPWHKGDYPAMPNEAGFRDAVRPLNIPPGEYMVPRAGGMKDMKSPEFQEKLNRGPVLMATVFPNGPGSMGRSLVDLVPARLESHHQGDDRRAHLRLADGGDAGLALAALTAAGRRAGRD